MNFLEERIAKDEGSAATARFRYSGGNGGRFGDGYPAEKAEKITTNYIFFQNIFKSLTIDLRLIMIYNVAKSMNRGDTKNA
jgi:hypothetical protein